MRYFTRRKTKQTEKEEKMNKINLILIVAGILITVSSVAFFPQTYAQDSTHIGIEWSNTCLKLIELGDLETCGNPELIKLGYPSPILKSNFQKMFDDMDQNDKQEYQKNNIYYNHVKSCISANYCNVFDIYGTNTVYWYDFDKSSRSYLDKIITIHANLKHTNLNVQNDEVFINATSRTLILDTNQINIQYCHLIAYTPDNYRIFVEMGGLMWFLSSDCIDYSRLGVLALPYVESLELTYIEIDKSPNWNILKQFEALKTKYKENRLGKD